MTIGRVGGPSRPCIFPFKYVDMNDRNAMGYLPWMRYDKCALDYDGRPFCPTNSSDIYMRDGIEFAFRTPVSGEIPEWDFWGHCNPDCPVSTGPGGE